jgi:glucuronoarabinoxylan endo-1,4-beta-xylanase
MSPQEMVNFIKVLGPKLATLNQRPLLMMPETCCEFDLSGYTNAVENDFLAFSYVDIYATHQYAGIMPPPSTAKPLWQTEMSVGRSDDITNFDPSMANGIQTAQTIHDAIVTGGVVEWNYWLLVNDAWTQGLIGHATPTVGQHGVWTKRVFALGNYSKFVRPGFVRIDASGGPGGVSTSAYVDPNSGNIVIVAINSNSYDVSYGAAYAGNFPSSVTPWVTSDALNLKQQGPIDSSSGRFTTTLPASSVTTFVGGNTIKWKRSAML